MKTNTRRTSISANQVSATNSRNFRTFLLMAQFEAREIGARIQQVRKERGLTQEELAELCDVTPRTIQNWEAGDSIPYRRLKDLARFLNKTEEFFLYGAAAGPAEEPDEMADRLERIERALQALVARLSLGEQADHQGQ